MNEFSSYLKEYIANNSINVSSMGRYCQIDRGTMYKYINGKLLPPSMDLLVRMEEYMKQSPSEQQIFYENYRIAKVGRLVYNRRQKTESFFLHFPDHVSFPQTAVTPPIFKMNKMNKPAVMP